MLKIEENVKNLLKEIPQTNPFGEKVTLVAADILFILFSP